MRLRTVDPPLPENLLDALGELGIKTDADFLFSGTPMELYKRLPLGTVTLAALTKHVDDITRFISAPAMRGDKLLEKEENTLAEHNKHEYLCGIPPVDKLMDGFGGSRVIEVSGDRGSGKTVQFKYCLNLNRAYLLTGTSTSGGSTSPVE